MLTAAAPHGAVHIHARSPSERAVLLGGDGVPGGGAGTPLDSACANTPWQAKAVDPLGCGTKKQVALPGFKCAGDGKSDCPKCQADVWCAFAALADLQLSGAHVLCRLIHRSCVSCAVACVDARLKASCRHARTLAAGPCIDH